MIRQDAVFAVMVRSPEDGDWRCIGVSRTEEDAEQIAATAIDTINLSYSFRENRLRQAVSEVMDSVRIIPAVLGYDTWDLHRD